MKQSSNFYRLSVSFQSDKPVIAKDSFEFNQLHYNLELKMFLVFTLKFVISESIKLFSGLLWLWLLMLLLLYLLFMMLVLLL